jgi:hypothetical protein
LAHREIIPDFISQIVAHLRSMLGLDNTTEMHCVEDGPANVWDIESTDENYTEEDKFPF